MRICVWIPMFNKVFYNSNEPDIVWNSVHGTHIVKIKKVWKMGWKDVWATAVNGFVRSNACIFQNEVYGIWGVGWLLDKPFSRYSIRNSEVANIFFFICLQQWSEPPTWFLLKYPFEIFPTINRSKIMYFCKKIWTNDSPSLVKFKTAAEEKKPQIEPYFV